MTKLMNQNMEFVAGGQIIRMQLEQLAADPGAPDSQNGRMYYNTGTNEAKYFNGTTWVAFPAGAISTDVTVTETPTGVTIQSGSGATDAIGLVDATNAGAMSPADKVKLDAIDGTVIGNMVGQVSTSAALDAITDTDGTAAVENGDIAFLDTDEGGREAGFYMYSGGAWPATPFLQVPDLVVAATETAAGLIELATTAEALAGTDTTRAITPATLKAVVDGKTASLVFGDGSTGPFAIAHGLTGTQFDWSVYDAATGAEIGVDGVIDGTNVTLSPVGAVAANAYRVNVHVVAA